TPLLGRMRSCSLDGCIQYVSTTASGPANRLLRVVNRPLGGMNMKLLSLNKGAVHGYRNEVRRACSTLEQGQAPRAEAAAEAERDLGYPDSPAVDSSTP